LRSALDPNNPNLRANPTPTHGLPTLWNTTDLTDLPIVPARIQLPTFSPEQLIGKSFPRTYDSGNTYKATVVKRINAHQEQTKRETKFLLDIGDGAFDELISYHELSQLISNHQTLHPHDPDTPWTFTSILDHIGPLPTDHPEYKGSAYYLLIRWDDDSETYEPLAIMFRDDPVTLAIYAQQHDLLDTPGWKHVKRFLPNNTAASILIHKSVTSHQPPTPIYQFGIEVPKNVKQAYTLHP
jgi:hypothetical protein